MEKSPFLNGDFSILDGETVNHSFEKKRRYMIYKYKQSLQKSFDKGRLEKYPFYFPDLSDKKNIEKSFPFKKNVFHLFLKLKNVFFLKKLRQNAFPKK